MLHDFPHYGNRGKSAVKAGDMATVFGQRHMALAFTRGEVIARRLSDSRVVAMAEHWWRHAIDYGDAPYRAERTEDLWREMRQKHSLWTYRLPFTLEGRRFYVSVVDKGRYGLLAGPFVDWYHAKALLEPATRLAKELDPWGVYYAYGTCSVPIENCRPGVLNDRLGVRGDTACT